MIREHARNLVKQSALDGKYTRWLLAGPLRRQMSELLDYGPAMEGLVICN